MFARPANGPKSGRRAPTSSADQPIASISRRSEDHVSAAQGAKSGLNMAFLDVRDITADKDDRTRAEVAKSMIHPLPEVSRALSVGDPASGPNPGMAGAARGNEQVPPPGRRGGQAAEQIAELSAVPECGRDGAKAFG
jgi:hypothetical protein